MRRRSFLGGLAAGALGGSAILGCPGWIQRAMAQEAPAPDPLAVLSDAYRRAQRRGMPLLVIVVPESGETIWDRQYAFGELLNHGGDAVMRDLALVELVCADAATLRTLVPQVTGEPLMALIETDRVPATVVPLDAALETLPSSWGPGSESLTWEEQQRREDEAIDRRIALLAGLVHTAVAADAAAITRRATVARAHVPAAELARVDAAIARGSIDATTAALAPAIVADAAAHAPALGQALVDVGVERWVRGQVPGSEWAAEHGCGLAIEGRDDQMMMACGMGHVPERSSRLLYWQTRTGG